MTVVLPRLCLFPLDSEIVVSGHGPNIEWIEGGKIYARLRCFDQEGSHVFGIAACPKSEALFVYGEKYVAFVSSKAQDGVLPIQYVKKFHDTILALKVLANNQVVILFMSNLCVLFNFNTTQGKLVLTEELSVQSEHIALMLHGLILGDTWGSLRIITGTVFGEIFCSEPASGPELKQKMLGHTGMIFGLHVVENMLFSISDDRSLRVWPLNKFTSTATIIPELDTVYGHSARPFAVCSSKDGHIYTAGIDQLVCKWKLNNDQKLILEDQISLNTGGIRSLLFFRDSLFVGSESGALLSVKFANPSSNAAVPLSLETCEDLRGFGFLNDDLFTVNGKGNLFRNGEPIYRNHCLRYITIPSCHNLPQLLVAYERNAMAIFSKTKECLIPFKESNLLSAVCSNSHVFAYTMNKYGYLYDCDGNLLVKIDASESITALPKKTSFLPSAIEMFCDNIGQQYIIVGSTCGHLVYYCLNSNVQKFLPVPEISRKCAKGQVMSIRNLMSRIAVYCKNGSLSCWSFKDGKFVQSSLPLIRGSPSVDWPCGSYIYDNREFIAEFHSTFFRLLDKNSGFAVLEFLCGGGNRPWFFKLYKDISGKLLGSLYFTRKEILVKVTAGVHDITYICDSLHASQIIAIQEIARFKDASLVCTSGVDCQVTFSKINTSTQDVMVLNKVSTPDGITAMSTLGVTTSEFSKKTLLFGSGKGSISTWDVYVDDENVKDLIVTETYQYPNGTRVLDLMTEEVARFEHLCVAFLADGNIISLCVRNDQSADISLCSVIEPPDLSLFTRGQLVKDNLFWVSTSGKLGVHTISSQTSQPQSEISAVKCGISCISTLALENNIICVIGDESGLINVFNLKDNIFTKITCLEYHSATVTDINVYSKEQTLFIYSVSLDCRAAVHELNITNFEAHFVIAKSLSIWDPARFIQARNHIITVGSGLEILELDVSC